MAERPAAVRQNIHIVGVGGCTSVGASARVCAAAVRARLCRFEDYIESFAGRPDLLSVASPGFLPYVGIVPRLKLMAQIALSEALAPISAQEELELPLSVALPANRPGVPNDLTAQLRGIHEVETGAMLRPPRFFAQGHAAGLLAVIEAAAQLNDKAPRLSMIAGVDSYLEVETIQWLVESGRILDKSVFVPGEAAGACLMCNDAALRQYQFEPLATVIAWGQSTEEAVRGGDEPSLGRGLSRALTAALAGGAAANGLGNIICDLNGEKYRTEEWMFTAARLNEHFGKATLLKPCSFWGDVGAASGPLLLVLAALTAARLPHLVWAASDGGERCALLVAAH